MNRKKKNEKRTVEETSGTTSSILKIPLYRSQKEKKEKQAENISENLIAENLPNLGKKTVT